MKRSVSFLISFSLVVLVFSCSKEGNDQNIGNEDIVCSADDQYIKSISMYGEIVYKYFYNETGKIVEENCKSYCKRYLYDENERLVKIESAYDMSVFSSGAIAQRTEFMTFENSPVTGYSLYKYDKESRLSKIENYFNETGKDFEYRSMQTFEYEGSYIVKVNLHEPEGQIAQFRVYTYDDRGNVANEKYYSNLFGSKEELLTEFSYKYDNYENPFRIFSILGIPGRNTNVNNFIEISVNNTNSTYYTNKCTYQYNEYCYPVKFIYSESYGESVEEYAY